jgi:hypothetical protein
VRWLGQRRGLGFSDELRDRRKRREGLAGGFAVTGVRVEGSEARALLGSRTLPASFVVVTRERGAWKIDELIGQPLP